MKSENYNIITIGTNSYIFVIMKNNYNNKNAFFKTSDLDRSLIIHYHKGKIYLKYIDLKIYENIKNQKKIRIVELDKDKITSDYELKRGQ
jgi:hypothetical protein